MTTSGAPTPAWRRHSHAVAWLALVGLLVNTVLFAVALADRQAQATRNREQINGEIESRFCTALDLALPRGAQVNAYLARLGCPPPPANVRPFRFTPTSPAARSAPAPAVTVIVTVAPAPGGRSPAPTPTRAASPTPTRVRTPTPRPSPTPTPSCLLGLLGHGCPL